ncbi:lipoyl protein ligase domain-containing protein [Halocatena marina]|uniref:lipoyl protein ligase domain-containing protein n=1 Tax=Halocatena marina TaxID=2934937 RepID=UPI00222505D5|nr:lipoate--protein ligase family protein [Halocatena marina]
MRVLRGRAETIDADRAVTQTVLEDTRETGESVIRVWTPHRQIAFGRRDANTEGYGKATHAANEHGFPAYERSVGGRAVAYTGETIAFARTEPLEEIRRGMQDRYSAAVTDLQVALMQLDVHASPGEPANSFCPGSHSLQAGGKIVGVAQRVQRGVALVAGIVVVRDHTAIAAVLSDVYAALGVPFDPDSVGSIGRAGGDSDPERAQREIEQALVGLGSDENDKYNVEYVRQD